ncbi:glycosyltransferase family 4 protein [Micromonospora aurantiaca (nom. illeg.)]
MSDPSRDHAEPALVLLGAANSIHVRRWATALAARGHRVAVASWVAADPIPGVELLVPARAGRANAGRWQAVRRMVRSAWWLRRQVARVRPDVLHVHSVSTAGALSLAVPRGVPRVVTPWGSDLRFAVSSRPRGWVARAALLRADLVVPTSGAVRGEVTQRYRVPPDRSVTLSWGVDDELIRDRDVVDRAAVRARFGIPGDATAVLSIRSASPVYRTADILAAFAGAARGRPDLHLVLLGGLTPAEAAAGRARRECLDEAWALARALPGRVTVLDGALPPAELFGLMRASEVAVSVPRWDQRSTTVLEAALAGCRLVLADLPPYRELVADGLVADLVPEPLTAGLTGLLLAADALPPADQRRNLTLITTAESWSHQVDAMRGLYRRVVGRRRRPAEEHAGQRVPH